MKKVLCLLLSFIILASLFAGCGTVTSSGSSSAAESKSESSDAGDDSGDDANATAAASGWPTIWREDPEHLEWMDDTSPITFSLFFNNMADDPSWTWGNDHVTQYITERTGVSIDISYPDDGSGDKLTLMLASGDPLPDIISYVHGTSIQYQQMRKGDYIYAIDELIDEYCPTLWDLLYPEEREFSYEEDGHIYYLTRGVCSNAIVGSDYAVQNGHIIVRYDVLQDMGLELADINSVEKMYEVLDYYYANADQYPEIKYPVYLHSASLTAGIYLGLTANYSGFGNGMVYDPDENAVRFWFDSENGKESIRFFNGLYKEGHLSKVSYIEDMGSILQAGECLFAFKSNAWDIASYQSMLEENVPGASYGTCAPFTLNGGEWALSRSAYLPSSAYGNCVITKDCSDPERAIKFLQFLRSEEGGIAVYMGIHGVDWEYAETDDGIPYCSPVGEMEGHAGDYGYMQTLGIYRYGDTWLVCDGAYDFITDFSSGIAERDSVVSVGRALWSDQIKNNVIECLTSLAPLAAGSEEADINDNCKNIYENYLAEMVFSDSDGSFDSLYTGMMTDLEAANMSRLFELQLPKVEYARGVMEKSGIVYD